MEGRKSPSYEIPGRKSGRKVLGGKVRMQISGFGKSRGKRHRPTCCMLNNGPGTQLFATAAVRHVYIVMYCLFNQLINQPATYRC